MEMLTETTRTLEDGTLQVMVLRARMPGQFTSDRVDVYGVKTETQAVELAADSFRLLDEKRERGE